MAFFDAQFALKESDVVAFSEGQRTAVEMQVGISISFEATWQYRNLKHPRYKNFYGYAQLMSGAFVVEDIPLTFLNQELVSWRLDTFSTIDAVVCTGKAIVAALEPKAVLLGYVVKTRQRYTSIRFRLLPGIQANITYVWDSGESNCDNDIRQPDGQQGQPPVPANDGASGGSRPSNQGGDGYDPSANDGNFNPSSGLPREPSPGGSSGSGTWKIPVTGYRQDDSAYSSVIDTMVTDRNAVIVPSTSPVGGAGSDGGKADLSLSYTVNGVVVGSAGTGFGLQFFNPYYN